MGSNSIFLGAIYGLHQVCWKVVNTRCQCWSHWTYSQTHQIPTTRSSLRLNCWIFNCMMLWSLDFSMVKRNLNFDHCATCTIRCFDFQSIWELTVIINPAVKIQKKKNYKKTSLYTPTIFFIPTPQVNTFFFYNPLYFSFPLFKLLIQKIMSDKANW